MDYALDVAKARQTPHAYSNFNQKRRGWVIPLPLEPHDHLRDPLTQPDLFGLAVRETAKIYPWAVAMPNLKENRIRTPEQAFAYREACRATGRPFNPIFDVTVPLYIEPDTDPQVVLAGFQAGAWRCAKVYPKNGTTNSDEGVDFRNIEAIFPAVRMMEKLGMELLVHCEAVHDVHGKLIADRLREPRAIAAIDQILEECPKIRLVCEHISKKEMVAAVKQWQASEYRVEATVAPQYLLWNSTKLFERGMNPVNYSIPILGDEEDRLEINAFVMDGYGMAGKDSAPHDIKAKSKPSGCPGGVFSGPTGIFAYFHIFRMYGGADWFDKFVEFQCRRAARFYDLPIIMGEVLITEESWNVPATYKNGSAEVIPLFAGMTMPYSYQVLTTG